MGVVGGPIVRVEAPGHIHMGNPDMDGSYGRLYGTLGLALEEPRVVVEARPGGRRCECPREDASIIFNKILEYYNCNVSVRVLREIPAHVGLGSTTTLFLALARAVHEICAPGRGFDAPGWALRLGRSRVSALGLYSFIHGGLLFDAGYRPGTGEIPPLLYRAEPPGWLRIIIALPEKPLPRILEIKKHEDEILGRMPRMDPSMADRLSRILLMGILGNIAAGDWVAAGTHITLFNRLLGEYWRGPQESIYCCPESERLIERLESLGAIFVGQSSWGPTVYGGIHENDTDTVLGAIKDTLDNLGGGRVWVTRPARVGAVVRVKW